MSTGASERVGGVARSLCFLAVTLVAAVTLSSCGGAEPGGAQSGATQSGGAQSGSAQVGGAQTVVLEEEGSIGPDDSRDPNHGNLPYDAFMFHAERLQVIHVQISADGFVPLLKLVEVATGAVLAEWEAEYSADDELIYTIAGPGEYEARVYAVEDGTGAYSIVVSVGS